MTASNQLARHGAANRTPEDDGDNFEVSAPVARVIPQRRRASIEANDTAVSNRLAALAADIRAAHEDVGRASKRSAERAVDAGRWLTEAKADDSIQRGGWDRWVEEAAGVPWSTAKHYIRLFRATSEQGLTVADITETGQIGALKEITRRALGAENEAQRAALKGRAPAPVSGRYGTVVIDPPWDMQKIAREVRPNQAGFDYPTMTEDELAAFPLGAMAADSAHLFCWTTHKHLLIDVFSREARDGFGQFGNEISKFGQPA